MVGLSGFILGKEMKDPCGKETPFGIGYIFENKLRTFPGFPFTEGNFPMKSNDE